MNSAHRVVRPSADPKRSTPGEAPPPSRRAALRLVEAAGSADRRRRTLSALSALGAVALLFGVVIAHVLLTQRQFRLDRLEDQAAAAQERYEDLRVVVAQLEAPERVVTAAQERLGMVPADGEVTYLTPKAGPPPAAPVGDGTGAAEPAPWSTVKPYLDSRP